MTIDGVVAGDPDARAVFVNATFDAAGETSMLEHRDRFDVRTDDGARIVIELARHPVIRPERAVTGRWRTLAQHPVQPTRALQPDDRVALRGTWIAPGERVSVIGYAKEQEFVADSGGPREAPERQLRLVRAIAIGIGTHAVREAKRAYEQRLNEIAKRGVAQPHSRSPSIVWAKLIIVSFVIGVVLVVRALTS